MEFEWDPAKASSNRKKHGVSFEEAQTVFLDPHALPRFDAAHSMGEDREITIGLSHRLRLLYVVHTERHGDTIRLISARKATRAEAAEYAEAQG